MLLVRIINNILEGKAAGESKDKSSSSVTTVNNLKQAQRRMPKLKV